MRVINWIVIHSLPEMPEPQQLYIQHRRTGLFDYRFHWLVRRCGTVVAARPEALPGIHLPGYDASSIAIAVPQMTGRGWSNPLVLSLADLIQQLLTKHTEAEACLASQLDNFIEFPNGAGLLERLQQVGLS